MELTRFLVAWRTIAVGDREVIDALVDPVHATPSAELRGALAAWPGSWYWSDEDGQRHLVLTRPYPGRARERWGVHIALFLATLITTTLTGALVAGGLPHTSPIGLPGLGLPLPELLRGLARGLLFSLPLLAILLAHELGHYVTARRYDLDVSPPYFLPLPVVGVVPGTLGAFIRLRTLVSDRRQLLDVAAAGPIAGFVVALPLLALGVALSQPSDANGVVILVGDLMTPLGDSFVTWAVRAATMGEVSGLILHPTAIAGYVGILVTMLNLLPISQLDGGHIVFATLPRWQKRVAAAFLALILALGWYSRWPWWWVFGAVVLLLSRGRLGNPPVLDAYRPLPTSRRWLGWAALALFLLTFTPAPVRV